MKPTNWVDLTDLSIWTGHHTGIQRVVYNIAKQYAAHNNAKFFVYDEKHRVFEEVDFAIINTPKAPPKSSWKKNLKKRVKKSSISIYSSIPYESRQKITPKLKPIARFFYHKSHHAVHLAKQTQAGLKRKKHFIPVDFKENDRVIILGAGWVRPKILNDLYNLKQTNKFKIFHFIHDVIPIHNPHLFGPGHFELFTKYIFDVASVCDGIITNSKYSREDYLKYCREQSLPLLPVDVIRLGDELEMNPEQEPVQGLEPKSFILAVGTIEIRKNYSLLYTAYKLAIEKGIKLPRLVIVGRPGWNAGDTVYAIENDASVDGKIKILKSVDDAALAWLYSNCLFTVYPSIYEGWGLPIAESMVHGKLCITSKTSSMPEVAGDLAAYFSPYDTAECLDVIKSYLDEGKLKLAEKKIKAGYKVQLWSDTYMNFEEAVEKQISFMDAQ